MIPRIQMRTRQTHLFAAPRKIAIFQCNSYTDGEGEIGNLIDVATQVINHYGVDNIIPYFVITVKLMDEPDENEKYEVAEKALAEAILRFKKGISLKFQIDLDKQLYDFFPPKYSMCNLHPDFSDYINDDENLKAIYAQADFIFNIATLFPKFSDKVKLKKNVKFISITEHAAASYNFDKYPNRSLPAANYYVTGIHNECSGLMVQDLSCDLHASVRALQDITDHRYINSLGLDWPVSDEAAYKYIQNTLVVPVYLGVSQQDDLAPLVHFVARSPLASQFSKVVFHINKRAYNKEKFDAVFDKFILDESMPDIHLMIGHYLENPDDYRRIYQLSSGRGIAIISSDKALELTISCDLLPMYPPVEWKTEIYDEMLDFIKDNDVLSQLHGFSRLTSGLERNCSNGMLEALYSQPYCSLLTNEAVTSWHESKRPLLLQNSFYHKLHNEILNDGPSVELERCARVIVENMMTNLFTSLPDKLTRETALAEKGQQSWTLTLKNNMNYIISNPASYRYHDFFGRSQIDISATIKNVIKYLTMPAQYTGLPPNVGVFTTSLRRTFSTSKRKSLNAACEIRINILKSIIGYALKLPEKSCNGILSCLILNETRINEDEYHLGVLHGR
jgi:hypothetical protein